MDISFKRLTEVDKFDIIELMNHPSLKRHMPLMSDEFTEDDCDKFIGAKEQLWADHGYGPWAFCDGQQVCIRAVMPFFLNDRWLLHCLWDGNA